MNKQLWVIQKFAFNKKLDLDGLIMKIVNMDDDRPNGCAINHLYKESKCFERVCAGKCNCGNIHQLFGNKVVWSRNLPSKDFPTLLAKKGQDSLLYKLF